MFTVVCKDVNQNVSRPIQFSSKQAAIDKALELLKQGTPGHRRVQVYDHTSGRGVLILYRHN